jgi:hypothetical protein
MLSHQECKCYSGGLMEVILAVAIFWNCEKLSINSKQNNSNMSIAITTWYKLFQTLPISACLASEHPHDTVTEKIEAQKV